MSYGTFDQVGSLARVWTDGGLFTGTTNPTDSQVNEWLDQVSATMDGALALKGFVTPVTNVAAVKVLTLMVTSIVADLAHAANSSGRFFTTNAIERGVSPMIMIRKEIMEWADEWASGLEGLGATRLTAPEDQIAYREVDNAGKEIAPIFERNAFGNDFQEWNT